MWESWNTQRYPEFTRKYLVCHMQNIRLPPATEDVEKEPLKGSQVVAKKCGDEYATVTYELAVAKIPKQIPIQNSPVFYDCSIHFGQIHTILSVYS